MIRATSTVIVHRPERILYYLPEITDEVKKSILDGVCPADLQEHIYTYGTYDEAGLFYLPAKLQQQANTKTVVGIEYRLDDDTVNRPEHLPHIILPACDIIIQDIAHKNHLDESLLDEIIDYARNTRNARSNVYRYVKDGLVAAFMVEDKLRIMYEIELVESPKYLLDGSMKEYTMETLYEKAYREPITGYYNWWWMWECLSSYHLAGIKDYGFVHFDIKDFNMINEIYNHHVANDVLIRITQSIEANEDWIYFGARCHNDNFAMMIKDMPEAETKAKLEVFFDELSTLDVDEEYKIYFRCGVVTMRYAMNAGNKVADYAKLAQATGNEVNVTEIKFYTEEMHDKVFWGKQLKAYLDTAIQSDEFLVYLQPKMDINCERICGAEALIRWDYKHKGLMPPYRFIPYFEQDGSIVKVDEVVLHKVCQKLKEWKACGYELHPISVNLSRRHMEQTGLVEHLTAIVDAYGVEHSLIEFELTESAAYDNQRYMVSVLQRLKDKGFLISMDDFGTGYSSFGLLKDMPLDTLKIDKSFVDLIATEEVPNKNKIILCHIISMAKALGIHCIAEGAEEYEQVAALRELGCDTVQGYYYSKPLPMNDFEEKYIIHK